LPHTNGYFTTDSLRAPQRAQHHDREVIVLQVPRLIAVDVVSVRQLISSQAALHQSPLTALAVDSTARRCSCPSLGTPDARGPGPKQLSPKPSTPQRQRPKFTARWLAAMLRTLEIPAPGLSRLE